MYFLHRRIFTLYYEKQSSTLSPGIHGPRDPRRSAIKIFSLVRVRSAGLKNFLVRGRFVDRLVRGSLAKRTL